jgi:plasmid stabilization system protein ParE
VRAAIPQSLQNLLLFPYVGRSQTVEGVRKLIIRKYPYLVYYTVDEPGEEIAIRQILDRSRREPELHRSKRRNAASSSSSVAN